MPRDLRVGCAAWADPDLVKEGGFYPQKTMSPEDRLRWYGDFFSFVEVNSTYYSLLSERNAALWARRTANDFLFGIKAWAPMTGHPVNSQALPREFLKLFHGQVALNARGQLEAKNLPAPALDASFEMFRDALKPLAAAGKLGYVLFQMAPWVRFGTESLAYLAALPRKLPGLPLAVEFRHRSWMPDHESETLGFLKEHGLIHAAVDGPGMPRVPVSTGPVFVLRCHGQNFQGWVAQLQGKSPTVAEKYDYLYSESEVRELIGSLQEASGPAQRRFLVFNNNRRNYPVVNALQARRLLGQPVPDLEERRDAFIQERRKTRLAPREGPSGQRELPGVSESTRRTHVRR